jgi:CheY-like chemotaxis protein
MDFSYPVASSGIATNQSLSRGGLVVSERILVVDDDRPTADMQAMLINTLGYEAKAVYSGQEAVEQIVSYEPDMALIDIGMPERNGYDTVAGIRQQPGGTHVILVAVTGWSRDEDKRRAYESGFDLHIAKPMRVETLRELIALLDPEGESAAGNPTLGNPIPHDRD